MARTDTSVGKTRFTLRIFAGSVAVLAVLAGVVAIAVWRAPIWVASKLLQTQLAFAGIPSEHIVLDGQEMRYFEGGTGAPIVLVHGLGSSALNDWAKLLPYLVRGGHHVYAMDLLGYGESAKPTDRNYSIPEQARLVERFLDEKHLEEVALGGESMGGWISATVALDQPQGVRLLLLFDSAGLWFRPSFNLNFFTPQTREQVDALFAILTPHPDPLPDFVKDAFVRKTKHDGWVVERALTRMTETPDDPLDQRLSSLKMPLLIVWGKEDVLIPLAIGQTMHHAVRHSVLEVYDDCGHIAVLPCADRIGPMVIHYLDGKGPVAGSTIEVPLK